MGELGYTVSPTVRKRFRGQRFIAKGAGPFDGGGGVEISRSPTVCLERVLTARAKCNAEDEYTRFRHRNLTRALGGRTCVGRSPRLRSFCAHAFLSKRGHLHGLDHLGTPVCTERKRAHPKGVRPSHLRREWAERLGRIGVSRYAAGGLVDCGAGEASEGPFP